MDNLTDALEEAEEMILDFSATSDDFENLPMGRYLTIVTKAKPGKTRADDPALKITYKVLEGDLTGRYGFSTLNTNGKAAWKARKAVKAIGGTPPVEGKRMPLNPSNLVDRKVIIEVDEEGWVTDWTAVPQGDSLE